MGWVEKRCCLLSHRSGPSVRSWLTPQLFQLRQGSCVGPRGPTETPNHWKEASYEIPVGSRDEAELVHSQQISPDRRVNVDCQTRGHSFSFRRKAKEHLPPSQSLMSRDAWLFPFWFAFLTQNCCCLNYYSNLNILNIHNMHCCRDKRWAEVIVDGGTLLSCCTAALCLSDPWGMQRNRLFSFLDDWGVSNSWWWAALERDLLSSLPSSGTSCNYACLTP